MKWIRRLTFAIGLVLLLLLLTLTLVVNKPALVIPTINNVVSTALDRPFEIKGDVSLSLYPNLVVEAKDINLGNPEWSNTAEMVSVEQFNATIDPMIFFSEQAEAPELSAKGIKVILEKNIAGDNNWEFQTESETKKNSGDFSFSLLTGKLEIKDFRVQSLSTIDVIPKQPPVSIRQLH